MNSSRNLFTRDVAKNYIINFVILQMLESKVNRIQWMMQTIMLANLLFFKCFVHLNKKVNYNRHSMLYFPLCFADTSTYYNSSTKYK